MNHFEIVAHRGISTEAPENTMASFRKAIELGADAVELDVRLPADKIPVVYHYYYLQENNALQHQNIEIHAWDVNDEQSLQTVAKFGIPRICTDYFKLALAFRDKMS
jgi:glycerophosphoryl diester phosphodiesterase